MIYPSITKLISIGQSVQKRNIWALEITNKELETEQPKPAFKYIANVYGKEIIGRGICLYLIDYLCSNYGKKENITKLIDNTKIYIIPSLNPDGSELHQNTNANNVYLDEDFLIIPSTFDENYWNNTIPSEDYLKKRQPETQALMKFILQISNNTFIMGANLREGHLAITYPYNFNYYQIKNFLLNQRNVSFNNDHIKNNISYLPLPPDNDIFTYISMIYSKNHVYMWNNSKILNGALAPWIIPLSNQTHKGSIQDWNYLQGCFEITIWLTKKNISNENLSIIWKENKNSLITYMEQIHKLAIKGKITDAISKSVVQAYIMIKCISCSSLNIPHIFFPKQYYIRNDPISGWYFRLLISGNYEIQVSSPGYLSSFYQLQINEGEIIQEINFQLWKDIIVEGGEELSYGVVIAFLSSIIFIFILQAIYHSFIKRKRIAFLLGFSNSIDEL